MRQVYQSLKEENIVPSELQFADRFESAFRQVLLTTMLTHTHGDVPGATVNNYLTDQMHSSLKPTFLTDSIIQRVQLELQ